ncbi:Periphilin-1 [Toxocara canis]|uniref:Periphilin-1 n=1 Tax=Toxocara canis TaxID=6265 RepID=A0A0B2VYD5_TOXCA|nr:Periphilin-1 [Toxocara canis]
MLCSDLKGAVSLSAVGCKQCAAKFGDVFRCFVFQVQRRSVLANLEFVKQRWWPHRVSPPPLPPRALKTAETILSDTSSFTKKTTKDVVGKGVEMAKAEATSSSSLFSTDIDSLLGKRPTVPQTVNTALFDDLKSASTNAFATVRGQQAAQMSVRSILDDPDEPVQSSSGLRLSIFTRQLNAETERDRKLARLPPELLSKFAAKKKHFEMAFKSDCETFGFVAKTLFQKDPGLEERLRLALAEAIKDLEEAFTQKIDQFLDQLVMIASM